MAPAAAVLAARAGFVAPAAARALAHKMANGGAYGKEDGKYNDGDNDNVDHGDFLGKLFHHFLKCF